MVGMASKKENATACCLASPEKRPPTIEAADREIPGTIDTVWNKPMVKRFVIWRFWIFFWPFFSLGRVSIISKATPPTISETIVTEVLSKRYALMSL